MAIYRSSVCGLTHHRARSAVEGADGIVDGEVVVLDRTGKAEFYDPMAGRGAIVFPAFHLMC